MEIGPSGQGRSRPTASATTAHRQKRPAAGTCQPKVSSSIGFRPGQAEPKTFSGRLSDFPTTTLCAQLWFEGAGGRPPAATAPPSEATSPEGGEPRLWGSVAAHARVEPPEQVVACASDHAHLGHGKGAAAQLEGDAVGVERRSRATALCSFCSRQAELQTGARRPNKYDTCDESCVQHIESMLQLVPEKKSAHDLS